MSKKKPPKVSIPEMSELFEGMQDLLCDEYGNPLPEDSPQYKKVKNFLKQLEQADQTGDNTFPSKGPEGHA